MGKKTLLVAATGAVLGAMAVALVKMGNPPNMGYCVACFLRDITGAFGLHRNEIVQYMRPEIFALVTGAFLSASFKGEVKAVGGSSPFTRFVLAFAGMLGMLVFLGCPVRAGLRLAGGDMNAAVGILGLIAGIVVALRFLNRGFSLGRAVTISPNNAYIFPALASTLLLILVLGGGSVFFASSQGPGSMHAPILISTISGLIIGIMAQRSRFCTIGGLRDFILFRDTHLLVGLIAMILVAFAGNLLTGNFKPGFTGQPIAHTDGIWNFLGMMLAGFSVTLLGGCPLRQLVAASEGNTDCAVTITGFIAGAAFAHNFGLAGTPKGVPFAGQVAVIIGLLVVTVIALAGTYRSAAVRGGATFGQNS